ncbi:hypothetical protein ACEQPO_10795 [Bacillus sp. SL00103]
MEKESIPVQRAEQPQPPLRQKLFVRAEEELNQLRLIKDESEIATLKKPLNWQMKGSKLG